MAPRRSLHVGRAAGVKAAWCEGAAQAQGQAQCGSEVQGKPTRLRWPLGVALRRRFFSEEIKTRLSPLDFVCVRIARFEEANRCGPHHSASVVGWMQSLRRGKENSPDATVLARQMPRISPSSLKSNRIVYRMSLAPSDRLAVRAPASRKSHALRYVVTPSSFRRSVVDILATACIVWTSRLAARAHAIV